jgi:hypothetical protein
VASAFLDCVIELHQFGPCGLQALQHHLPNAHRKFVTETVIDFSPNKATGKIAILSIEMP